MLYYNVIIEYLIVYYMSYIYIYRERERYREREISWLDKWGRHEWDRGKNTNCAGLENTFNGGTKKSLCHKLKKSQKKLKMLNYNMKFAVTKSVLTPFVPLRTRLTAEACRKGARSASTQRESGRTNDWES